MLALIYIYRTSQYNRFQLGVIKFAAKRSVCQTQVLLARVEIERVGGQTNRMCLVILTSMIICEKHLKRVKNKLI